MSRLKLTASWAMAWRLSSSVMAEASARSDFMNFSRAGVAKKMSRTSTRVPGGWGAGTGPSLRPPATTTYQPESAPGVRLVRVRRATDPMAGKASPRKPR